MSNSVELGQGTVIAYTRFVTRDNNLDKGEKVGNNIETHGGNIAPIIEGNASEPVIDGTVNSISMGHENGNLYRNGKKVKKIEPKFVKKYLERIGKQKEDEGISKD